jgi:hypothetical protein
LFTAAHEKYAADPKAAEELATQPLGALPKGTDVTDAAAWTTVSNVILNLDETLAKR